MTATSTAIDSPQSESLFAIETSGLTKRYGRGDASVLAVDDLNLRVGVGEVFGFLGPNGAGKSTTIDLLLDYIRPTEGTATVLGMDPREEADDLRRRIGVVPEGYGLYERLSGVRHLEFAIDWMGTDDDPDEVLDRVGLDRADAERRVGDYSKGMQQRLALGMALVGEPDLLILDEPSSGLDPHGIRRMREIVREEADRGATVFFSSHILDQVESVCDRVAILADGQLVGVDTIDGLRATVGQASTLRLHIEDNHHLDPARIEGVESFRWIDGVLHVSVSTARVKSVVIAELSREAEIVDIEVDTPSLEEVFTTYTGRDQPRPTAHTTGGRQ